MEIKIRQELVRKYFDKKPDKPDYSINIILSVLGFILLLAGISNGDEFGKVVIALSIILLIVQGILILTKYSSYENRYATAMAKATDEQMDNWLEEAKRAILDEALSRLDLDEDDASAIPLMIDGPADQARFAIGLDKILRFSHHDILLFFLTQHHVATFQCTLDMGTGAALTDRTKEFPYKDITNIETATITDFIKYIDNKKSAVRGTQMFGLFTSGANNITIKYFFAKSTDSTLEYILPSSDAENTIKAVRKRLKEYKDRFSSVNNL